MKNYLVMRLGQQTASIIGYVDAESEDDALTQLVDTPSPRSTYLIVERANVRLYRAVFAKWERTS